LLFNDQKQESFVGRKLSEFAITKVIILVILMIFTVPIFDSATYFHEPNSKLFGLKLVHKLGINT
jgi:hypothetical protein